ncbi:hypothetical protein ACWDTD_02920 [Gordonia sp. NPDC003425]
MSRMLALLVTATAAAALLVASGAQANAAPGGRACGWTPVGNVLYPDLNARYWHVTVPLSSGQSVRVQARFPHSRYMAYALQGPGGSGDAIHDTKLRPDSGSINPFVVGADRNATNRSYTMRVVPGSAPTTGGAPNTLYAGRASGSLNIVYRIYDVDRNVDQRTGGVGFPAVTVVDASGHTVSTCDANSGGVTPGASFGARPAIPDGVGAYGTNPPQWQKFINTPTVYTQLLRSELLGDALYDRASTATSGGESGGLGANVDNQYITTLANPRYGKVLVLRATMPTHPETSAGQTPMGSGQVRYWSMCSEILSTTQAVACVPDHEVPLGAGRTFTLVISAPQDRPVNATAACGVAWLPMSNGLGTVLIMRNMLADPSFAQSIAHASLNHEQATMGSYYPRGQYLSDAAAFDRLGCHAG